MTPERFRTLLDIYGSDYKRWPGDERDAARALGTEMQEHLAEAARLDRWLDNHVALPPDAALIRRITASAPAAASPPQRRLSWLWRGAGLAGIGLAGSLAGAFAVSLALRGSTPPPGLDWPERATAFTENSSDWSTE